MRKTKIVKIEAEGRDKGKVFVVTEMSARAAEMWGMRAFQALVRAGVQLPDGLSETGMAGFAKVGISAMAQMNFGDATDLADELMSCATIARDPSHPEISTAFQEEDIEEVKTRILLKAEALELHTGFSMAGVREKLNSSTPAGKKSKG